MVTQHILRRSTTQKRTKNRFKSRYPLEQYPKTEFRVRRSVRWLEHIPCIFSRHQQYRRLFQFLNAQQNHLAPTLSLQLAFTFTIVSLCSCLSLIFAFLFHLVFSDTIIIGIFYCLKWPSIKYVPMQRGGESVQKRTGAYRRGDALWSVSTYTSLFCFFRSEVCRFYNTNRFLSNLRFILPYLIDFQELHRCRIRRQVFITLYRSHSSL